MVLLAPVAGTAYLVYLIVSGIDRLFPDELRPKPFMGHPDARPRRAQRARAGAHCRASSRTTSSVVGSSPSSIAALQRVPLFGGTYGLIKQVFESVFAQGADSFNRAILIEYPRPGIWAIAFVTASHVPIAGTQGQELVSVFVPTTPNPTSGFYLLVDKKLVRELDMPVQQAFKLVITMGIAKDPELLTTTAKLQRKDLTL